MSRSDIGSVMQIYIMKFVGWLKTEIKRKSKQNISEFKYTSKINFSRNPSLRLAQNVDGSGKILYKTRPVFGTRRTQIHITAINAGGKTIHIIFCILQIMNFIIGYYTIRNLHIGV